MTQTHHNTAYDHLKERFKDIWAVNDALAILNRDMITVMPVGAGESRTQQMTTLSALAHEKISDPVVSEWLDQAKGDAANQNDEDQITLSLMERAHLHASSLPEDLARNLSRLGSIGHQGHVRWRGKNDWEGARAHLDQVFHLKREAARIKQDALGTDTLYDALIDEYDPYSSAAAIQEIFTPVEAFLKEAIPKAIERGAVQGEGGPSLAGPFPADKQAGLFRKIAEALGFDFHRGRMEMIPAHPSCYGAVDDSRFTTRIDEQNFIEPLRAAIHEIGHGLYEQNLNKDWIYSPLGSSVGMTIHESQSLFWERQVALNPAFYTWLAGEIKAADLADSLTEDEVDVWLRSQKTAVTPSLIRIEADEMTYPLHIILRFELEQQIMAGTLEAKDLPEAWNTGMQDKLGLTPPDNAHGCMQDIHWFCGDLGYFPSYSLGAMAGAQIQSAMEKDLGAMETLMVRGEFHPILDWLVKNIHRQGSFYKPMELMQKATGEPLNPEYFIAHLKQRYLKD